MVCDPAELAAARRERDPHRRALKLAELFGRLGRTDAACVAILAQMSGDPDAFVRALAVRALARIGGGEARDAIVHALGDTDAHVREAAWQVLDPADDELAIPLLSRIVEGGGASERARALHALRQIAERAGGPVALPEAAIAHAAIDPDRFVRAAAVRVAARLLSRPRAHALVLAALDDDEAWVRESAARGAGEAFGPGDRACRSALADALAGAREDATRLGLLRALARVAQEPAPGDHGMVGLARAHLGSADDGVRAAALLLLAVIARDADAALCGELAARLGDARPEIAAAAARLLGDLAPAGATFLLAPLDAAARRDVESATRRSIAAAARRIGTRAAEPLLRRLAEDADLQVAASAAAGLSELLNPT